jgi:hypothetical protein
MASGRDAVEVMTAGAAILAGELSPAGFTFQLTRQGSGSGGNFATGRFAPEAQDADVTPASSRR